MSTTKHAVQAAIDALRMELERDGVPVSLTLVEPGSVDTPYPEHARNYMDMPPRLPPPLYDPALVADAILFACEHPRRSLYVGGGGRRCNLSQSRAVTPVREPPSSTVRGTCNA